MIEEKYKILIIAPVWIGDLVMSQTLFILLANKYGDNLQLDVFATQVSSSLVKRMPQVNKVVINNFKNGQLRLFHRIKLGFQLRKEQYDEVIILPTTIKSAIMPFFAGIKKRVGFIGESRYLLINNLYKLNSKLLPRMIDRYCALGNNGIKPSNINYPDLIVDRVNQEKLIDNFDIKKPSSIIAFCPAAEYGPAKRWLPEYFATLADLLSNLGHQIIILGGPQDVEIGHQIINISLNKAHIKNLCGKTSLTDAADLLAMTKCVVTNDSGLMHVACAVKANVVAIYGSSSPEYTPPLSDKVKILKVDLECSPCFKRTCQFDHYNCLRFVSPTDVFNAVKSLIFEN